MSNVLLIIQLIISIILTGLILIQRSEGGALGIGGGGGGGGFMSGRSAASSISRATAILGGAFIINCLALSVVFNIETRDQSIIDDSQAEQALTIDIDSGDTVVPSIDVSPDASVADELSNKAEEILQETPEAEAPVETEETPDNP